MAGSGHDELLELIEPTVEALGYELAELEAHVGAGCGVVRLFIDSESGITLEDCEIVSRQVSSLLDVADPIEGDYKLEVSSPGLDRRLVKAEHYDKFAGSEIRVKLRKLRQGRRRYKGVLLRRDGENVLLREGDENVSIPLADIESARLVPEL